MSFDLRLPIGLMFTLFGSVLAIFGLATSQSEMYHRHSLDINVNFWWGVVLLGFGLFMLLMAWRAAKKATQAGGPEPSV